MLAVAEDGGLIQPLTRHAGHGLLAAQRGGHAEDHSLPHAGALGHPGLDFERVQFAAGDIDEIRGAPGEVFAVTPRVEIQCAIERFAELGPEFRRIDLRWWR